MVLLSKGKEGEAREGCSEGMVFLISDSNGQKSSFTLFNLQRVFKMFSKYLTIYLFNDADNIKNCMITNDEFKAIQQWRL